MPNLTFIMEQHLGHRAYYLNLRETLESDPRVSTRWVEVTYNHSKSRTARLPLPESLQGSLAGRQEILRGLDGGRPDALFFNTQVPAALVKDRLGKVPYVISTDITPLQYDRMAEFYHHRADSTGPIQNVKQQINRSLLQRAARLLPWSSWTAGSLTGEYDVPPERVEVLAPGVDLEVFRPGKRAEPGGRVRILFVGGDLERKGGLDVLEVFKTLPEKAAELVLVTRADVPETPGVRVVNDLQPNSAKLIELYQSSQVFVLPSKGEAFGIAAAEAAAAGLPAVTTAVGGLADIIVHGQTGFVVEPGNREQLKAALTQLIDDASLRRTMGQAARARAEQLFDAKKNARRTLEVLLDACSK